MKRKMTVVFQDEELCLRLKIEAVKRRMPASRIVAAAVQEWLESAEDAELLPAIESARAEWKEKGGRPWPEVKRDLEGSPDPAHPAAGVTFVRD